MSEAQVARVREAIRDVPDFPKPGILFKDITPVLQDPAIFRDAIELLVEPYRDSRIDAVLGIESRGFILGAPAALELGAAFVPVRKPGKLPAATRRVEYALEYGTDAVEIHVDALRTGERVLILDDLIATGGTAAAAVQLATELSAEVVGAAFLVELSFLNGADKLKGTPYTAALRY